MTNSDADPGTEFYTLEYRAVVANVALNRAGAAADNTAGVIYNDVLGQQQSVAANRVGATVVEPAITLTANAVPGIVPPTGGTTRVTLVIRNATGTTISPAHDLRLRGQLPSIFTQLGARTITASGAAGVVDVTVGPFLRINVGRLAPGDQVTIAFDATVGPNPPIGASTLDFTADWTSLVGAQGAGADGASAPGAPGTATGERTGDGGVNSYATAAAATILVAPLVVPTLSSAMLVLLALLLGFLGLRQSRRAG
ncbi:MAG: IPTL-CTERM sorting domain-containing protein [Betaproteobacteria bacterium]|nr:IPTL-CTERM sorting domain-containing protein [Betaproteobacteria bacterium]